MTLLACIKSSLQKLKSYIINFINKLISNMKQKILIGFATLAIAAVAALNVNLNTNSYKLSDISFANVEALANVDTPNGGGSTEILKGYFLKCVDGGAASAYCEIDGQITIGTVTLKGGYKKGGTYSYAWSRYSCEPTSPYVTSIVCDIRDQGVYVNGQKVS